MLGVTARRVETVPVGAAEAAVCGATRVAAGVPRSSGVDRSQRSLRERRRAAKRVGTWVSARQHARPQLRRQRLSRATTVGCSRLIRRACASRHMDHLPTHGRVSKARASHTQVASAQVSGRRRERRGCWTFTLGTCWTDFPRVACLPRSVPTGTSVRASLGSGRSEPRPLLTSFSICRGGAGLICRRGAGRLMQSGFHQSGLVPSRMSVSQFGRTSYIGAGEANPRWRRPRRNRARLAVCALPALTV